MAALILLLVLSPLLVADAKSFRLPSEPRAYLTREVHWFNQKLDHFSPTDNRQFKQRYYEFLDYYDISNGPVFLKICGESTCPGIINDYTTVLAKKFGAALVSLEHRYYGKSYPFGRTTADNLRYLSSKQALFDLAVFRQYYQESLNAKYNRSNVDSPWFTFGISYAGALSAWFRLKFPHLTCGSLASSAVVLAVYNFSEFDQQVGDSAGPGCKAALQEITKLVEQQLLLDGVAVKSKFGASMVKNDVDFLYLLADAAAIAFQYGNPDVLCSPLLEAKKLNEDLVETFAKYVKDYYCGKFGESVETYDQQHLKNTSIGEKSGDRLWWFQVCTEVAFFQVAPANDSVRSSRIDASFRESPFCNIVLGDFLELWKVEHSVLDEFFAYEADTSDMFGYHLDLCKNIFGESIYPEVDTTNIYYGGTRIAGSKIIFTNGSQDPWRHASKQTSSPEKDMPSYIVECHNCGHGTDLRGCPQSPLSIEGDAGNCTSPEAVQKVRAKIIEHVDLWLSECDYEGPGDDERDLFTASRVVSAL